MCDQYFVSAVQFIAQKMDRCSCATAVRESCDRAQSSRCQRPIGQYEGVGILLVSPTSIDNQTTMSRFAYVHLKDSIYR